MSIEFLFKKRYCAKFSFYYYLYGNGWKLNHKGSFSNHETVRGGEGSSLASRSVMRGEGGLGYRHVTPLNSTFKSTNRSLFEKYRACPLTAAIYRLIHVYLFSFSFFFFNIFVSATFSFLQRCLQSFSKILDKWIFHLIVCHNCVSYTRFSQRSRFGSTGPPS